MISIAVICFSTSIFVFVKLVDVKNLNEKLTKASSENCENIQNQIHCNDRQFEIEKRGQLSSIILFVTSMAISVSAILARRHAISVPVQIRVLRTLLKKYDDNENGPNA